MALIETAYSITVTLEDKDANRGSATMYMDGNALFPAVEAVSASFVSAIQALSDAAVTGYSVTKGYREDQPVNPPVGSEVERKGRFTFSLADTRTYSVSVPGLKDALVFPDTNVVNGNDAAVLAFIALIEASGTDAVGTDVVKIKTVKEVIV